jgi:hypothetical protein
MVPGVIILLAATLVPFVYSYRLWRAEQGGAR